MNATAIVPSITTETPLALVAAVEKARDYARASRAKATLKALRRDWTAFETWAASQGLASLPASPGAVAAYLGESAGALKLSTLRRRLWAIGTAHRTAGHPDPTKAETVKAVLAGIARTVPYTPARKAAAGTETMRALVDTLPENLLGARDRALLLLGFAAALRRSELVALDVKDFRFEREGLVVTIRRSKTDQEGVGHELGVPFGSRIETCPVRSLQTWLEAAGISEGPVFRPVNRHGQMAPSRLTDRSVALVVKRAAEAAGLDAGTFAGHSLRAGFATEAARRDVPEHRIMRQTRHRSRAMVDVYVREGSLFRRNAAAELGL